MKTRHQAIIRSNEEVVEILESNVPKRRLKIWAKKNAVAYPNATIKIKKV